jgi:PAS domain S-box-containing protein
MNSEEIAQRPIDRSQHELLIVDDDPASRYATSRLLRSAGFRTREVATGTQALQEAGETVSAMVLDVHLPDIDGFEIARILHSRPDTARLPILHLTAAFVTDEDKVRGLDSGADAYLTRPVEPAVLVATVQALVRTRVAETAMRRSEAKFRAIYAQALGGICLLSDDGEFLDANPAMLTLLGREPEGVQGRRVVEFVPPEWVERVAACTAHVTNVGSKQFPVVRPSGELVYLEWAVSPHIEPGINMALVSDVSARMLLQQQREHLFERERDARSAAEHMSRMKDDLIAVLSHELRTPLNAIMGWTHVLKLRGGSPELMRGLEAVERNGNIQARMISDILDMSRLNVGKMRLSLEPIDLVEAVTAAVNALRPATETEAPNVVIDVVPPSRALRADSSRLQQILWNLLSNAIKFSPPAGEIRVRVRERDDGVVLTVADHGRGIEPPFLPFVFDRFTQSDAASNRQHGGLGLGLSIVKQLVESHGGKSTARSAGLGLGSEFEIWLPFEPQVAPSPDGSGSGFSGLDEAGHAERPLHGLKLLVVDDDREACAMLQIILGDLGATVLLAYDAAGGLRMLDASAPDIVISDIGMPGQDGYEFVRELRRRESGSARRIPTIALTSFTRSQDQEQARLAGFDLHSSKPLRPHELVQQIRQLAGRT